MVYDLGPAVYNQFRASQPSLPVVFLPCLSQKARVPSPVQADQSIRGEIWVHANTYSRSVCVRSSGDARDSDPASAQSSAPLSSNRATGENYHVEISGSLWDPTPSIFISSESLEGILGSRIDFVEDLGIEKSWFTQLQVVLRPAEKHKFRFEYTPIKYDAETVLSRTIIFNGISFPVSHTESRAR